MPPWKFFSQTSQVINMFFCALCFSINLQAVEFEVTVLAGQTFSPDLANGDNNSSFTTTDEPNIALALAWQESLTGQGQILINYISRDFTDDINQPTSSFDTLYTHFSGVAFFKDRNYITTVGLGIGATYFNSDFDEVIYPSLTVAVGTRYEFSDSLAFITELRAYATLTDDNDTLFCQNDSCLAQFDRAVWFDGQISIGLAYRF
ncbi:MAG: hypothetical protein JKY81_08335 [Colwellia sp.]|nr:hypothetical protein [Colwellia sp.]